MSLGPLVPRNDVPRNNDGMRDMHSGEPAQIPEADAYRYL